MKYLIVIFLSVLFVSCNKNGFPAPVELSDQDYETHFTGKKGINEIVFEPDFSAPVLSYQIVSSGESPENDPVEWCLKGSNDGKKWTIVDKRQDIAFCSRFQPVEFSVQFPGKFEKYLLEITADQEYPVKIAEVVLSNKDQVSAWENFKYPKVRFEVTDPDTEGSKVYHELVQNPDQYIKYHARKVAEILFYTSRDTMYNVEQIDYTLKEYDGISAKGGAPPVINIVYSTKHVEKSADESLFKLDYETRGVLFHELVHAYQFEPKGIGSYSTNKEFWACIEGLADAVRSEAGFFDIQALRKPGGHWLDGYRTTGFFLQWLTEKDPDALRKFHLTVRDLDVWSFDEAMKVMFGPQQGIEYLWEEYQQFLLTNLDESYES